MDALVLASDVEEYLCSISEEYLGEDVHPIIFDLVDNFNSLKRHYYTKHNMKKVEDKFINLIWIMFVK